MHVKQCTKYSYERALIAESWCIKLLCRVLYSKNRENINPCTLQSLDGYKISSDICLSHAVCFAFGTRYPGDVTRVSIFYSSKTELVMGFIRLLIKTSLSHSKTLNPRTLVMFNQRRDCLISMSCSRTKQYNRLVPRLNILKYIMYYSYNIVQEPV